MLLLAFHSAFLRLETPVLVPHGKWEERNVDVMVGKGQESWIWVGLHVAARENFLKNITLFAYELIPPQPTALRPIC